MSRKHPHPSLNLNVRGMRTSATVTINEHSVQLRAHGREVFKLGFGQSPFPVPDEVVAALRDNAHQKDYLPVRGLPHLREVVAAYYSKRESLQRTAADVLIGPGSKELMFLLQLVYYGELIVPSPSWVSYVPQARIIGRHVRVVATRREDEWTLTPSVFARICEEDPGRPRLFILNYPNNPTGSTYTPAQLEKIARVARKHHVLLLSDEIYGELHHRGEHLSIARYYPEGTIISGGLSKWCGAGGWRLGTFVFPPELRWLLDAMAVAGSETFTATSAPIQYAAVQAYLGSPDIELYLQRARRILGALGGWVAARFARAGVHCTPPDGGFYVFADFSDQRQRLSPRGIDDSRTLASALLEHTGVATLPGCDFGRPDPELGLRIAYVDFDGAAALAAVDAAGELDETFLRAHAGNVMQAIERMCDWLNSSA